MDSTFNSHFQKHFVNHLLRNHRFLAKVRDFIDDTLISDEFGKRAVRLITAHWDQYKSAPGKLVFQTLDNLKSQNLLNTDLHKQMSTYFDDLFALDLENESYLESQLDQWLKWQSYAANVIPAGELLKQGRADEAEQLVLDIFKRRRLNDHDFGIEYTPDTSKRLKRRLEDEGDKFWTLIPPLDQRLQGTKRGELWIWQSQRSSGGKSAGLVHLARSAMLQNYKTLILSLEMGEEDYEDRLDMCCACVGRHDLTDTQAIRTRLLRLMRKPNMVRIKKMKGGKKTVVKHLQDFTLSLKEIHNFVPDVILVDYLDRLTSETNHGSNIFAESDEVSDQLREWASADKVYMWSGTQSGRGAIEAGHADQEHVAGGISKVYNADGIVSINRSPEQEKLNQVSLVIVKNRQGDARGHEIVIDNDFSKMQFWVPPELKGY